MISGSEFSVLLLSGDLSMIGAPCGCLLVDSIGRSCLLVSVLVWTKCGLLCALSGCGCVFIFSVEGLPLSVDVADICCDFS